MAAGYRALHDFHMAEDVFQITMLKLLNTERNMEDMRSARTRSFIYAVARNTAIDMYRKNQDALNSSRPAATSIKSIKRKKKTDSFAPALTNMSSNTALAKIFRYIGRIGQNRAENDNPEIFLYVQQQRNIGNIRNDT